MVYTHTHTRREHAHAEVHTHTNGVVKMVLQWIVAVLWAPNQFWYYVCFFYADLNFLTFFYITSLPLFPMTENRFWRSERKRGRRARTPAGLCWRANKPPLPSFLLTNVRSLENNLEELCSRLSYQRDLKIRNILCFMESWRNKDIDHLQFIMLAFPCQDRSASSGKRGGETRT